MLTIAEYAKLCELVYEDNAAIKIDQAFPGKFDDILEYQAKHLKALALCDATSQHGYIVFKGFEWYPGGILKMLSFKPGQKKVHPGLLADFELIREDLEEAIYNLREDCTDIHFVGHSWGGALAVLLSTQSVQSGFSYYFWTAPHWFFEIMSGSSVRATDHYLRVVNAGDILAELPLGFGYGHSGSEMFLSSNPKHVFDNPIFLRRVMEHCFAWIKGQRHKAHRIKNYVERLGQI